MESAMEELLGTIFKTAHESSAQTISFELGTPAPPPPGSLFAGLEPSCNIELNVAYDGEHGLKIPGAFAVAVLHALFAMAEVNPWEKGRVVSNLTDPDGEVWELITAEDQQSWTFTRVN